MPTVTLHRQPFRAAGPSQDPLPGDDEDEICPICQQPLSQEPVATLPCCHDFHVNCILPWFRSGHPECPLCRDNPHRLPAEEDAPAAAEEEEEALPAPGEPLRLADLHAQLRPLLRQWKQRAQGTPILRRLQRANEIRTKHAHRYASHRPEVAQARQEFREKKQQADTMLREGKRRASEALREGKRQATEVLREAEARFKQRVRPANTSVNVIRQQDRLIRELETQLMRDAEPSFRIDGREGSFTLQQLLDDEDIDDDTLLSHTNIEGPFLFRTLSDALWFLSHRPSFSHIRSCPRRRSRRR
jgi:ElaB/YqjD/DUF883 family membrane-anchored ribosome-binding protein